MNKLNFSNTGGFPLDTNILSFMQDSYDLFNALADMAGNLTILKGCTVSGSTVSDGIVCINGEVLSFKEGTGSTVIIKEDTTQLEFEDGNSKEVEKVCYATMGIGSNSYPWADFERLNPVKTIQKAIVPAGLISMWSGSITNIPSGWALCNGENNTPDLRGKFIVGAGDAYSVADTGGEEKHMLSVNEIPAHGHTGTTASAGGHMHSYKDTIYAEEDNYGKTVGIDGVDYLGSGDENMNNTTDRSGTKVYAHYRKLNTYSAGSHSHSVTINSNGGGKEHENRPPYYALAYIMFTGN